MKAKGSQALKSHHQLYSQSPGVSGEHTEPPAAAMCAVMCRSISGRRWEHDCSGAGLVAHRVQQLPAERLECTANTLLICCLWKGYSFPSVHLPILPPEQAQEILALSQSPFTCNSSHPLHLGPPGILFEKKSRSCDFVLQASPILRRS